MSTEVNNQVVQMSFNNKQFEKGASDTIKTVEKLKVSLNFDGVQKGLSDMSKMLATLPVGIGHVVSKEFNTAWSATDQFVRKVTNSIIGSVQQATNTLNIFKNGLQTGFSEYETKIGAVQTIWANTKDSGATMDDITRVLEELNLYADKTIYNFTEMTRNIGTFTAAGIGLEESSKAIQGIANLAAISGSTSQQASTAMYQLSQALASGRVALMDWNSVVNAGMGGKVFQNVLIETAQELGTINSEFANALKSGEKNFRETLTKEGWITSEVLTASLTKFTDTSTELGKTATEAATKVKTFTQLIDTLKESVQSGWTQSWEYIIGDFETARDLFTTISNKITSLIQPSMDARNEMLAYWSGANKANEEAEKVLKEQEKHQNEIEELAKRVNAGEFGNGEERFNAIESLGYDYREVQNAVNHLNGLGDAFVIEAEKSEKLVDANKKVNKSIDEMTGREAVIYGLKQIGEHIERIFRFAKSGFKEVFPSINKIQLVEYSKKFARFAESLRPSTEQLQAMRVVLMYVFNGFKLVGKVVKSVGKGILQAFGELPDLEFDVGKLISSQEDFSKFVNDFEKNGKLEKITKKVKEVTSGLIDAVSHLGDVMSEYVVEPLKKSFNELNGNSLTDKIMTFWETIKESFNPEVISVRKKAFDDKMTELTDPLNKWSKKFETFLSNGIETAKRIGSVLWDFAQNIFTWDNAFKLLKVISIKHTFDIMKSFSNMINATGGMFGSIAHFFGELSNTVRDITGSVRGFVRAESFKVIATGVLLLTASLTIILADIYLFSEMWKKDQGATNHAMISVVGLFAMLVWATRYLTQLDSIKPSVILGVSGLVLSLNLLITAILVLGKTSIGTLLKGGLVTIALGLALVWVASALGYINRCNNNLDTAGKSLIRLAVALNLLILPILALSLMTMEGSKLNIKAALGLLAGIVTFFGLFSFVMSKLIKNSEMRSVSAMILSVSGAIFMLMVPIVIMTILVSVAKLSTILTAVGIISGLFAVLSLVVTLMTKLTGSGDIAVSAGVIIAMSVALNLLMIPIVVLTVIASITDIATMWSAAGALSLLIVVFGIVMVAMSKLTTKGDIIVQALGLLAFAGTLLLIADVISKMVELDQGKVWSVVGALSLLVVIYGAFIALVAAFTGKLDIIVMAASFIAFAAALVIIAHAFTIIAEVPIGAMWNFVAVFFVLTLIFTAFIAILAVLNTVLPGSMVLILGLIDLGIAAAAAVGFAIAAIADSISNLIQTIMEFVAFIKGEDVEVMNATSDSVSSGLTKAAESGGKIDLAAVAAGEQTMGSFVKGMNNGKEGMVDAATMAGVAAGETSISSIVQGLNNNEADLYSQGETAGVNTINSVATGMETQGPLLMDGSRNIGTDMISNLSSGITDEANSNLYPALEDVSDNMLNVLNGGLAIESPSKETKETGKWFDEGMIEGVKENLPNVLETVSDLGSDALDKLETSLGDNDLINTITKGISDSEMPNDLLDLDSLTEGLNNFDNMGLDTTITPVMDLSDFSSGISDMNSMFNSSPMGLSSLNGSLNSSLDVGDIQNGSYDDTLVINSINNLNARIDALATAVSSMQIRMDTGALVGSIAGPMDSALGQRAVYAGRGIR